MLRLGVNIDHVATLRNARGGTHPEPERAARLAEEAGADGLTIHLREDRRHIRDADLPAIRAASSLPINLEMAATEDMLGIALGFQPHAACLVPERRAEVTTEGGLNVAGSGPELAHTLAALNAAKIRTSLFIDADPAQIEASAQFGAQVVELHTGAYAHARGEAQMAELERLREGAKLAHSLGLEVHAGHGLTFGNVGPIASIPEIVELNIGHFLMGEAMFIGLAEAIATMRRLMDAARA